MHIYIEIKVDAFMRIHKEDGQKRTHFKYLHRGHIKLDAFMRIHKEDAQKKTHFKYLH